MAKVSIIIPVYNVEPYIEKCIESVINQTFNDIECLIIDDCSTDNSILLTKKTISSYCGPIVFKILSHSSNKGLSAARNTGLINSTGEYVYFLDSDDYITENCIHDLYYIIKTKPDVEMSLCDISMIQESKSIGTPLNPQSVFLKEGMYCGNVLELHLNGLLPMISVNKLIKRSFIINNRLFFKEGLIHEDFLWSFQVACLANKIAVTSRITYIYRRREQSITISSGQNTKILNTALACKLQAEFASKIKKIWKKPIVNAFIQHKLFSHIISAYRLKNTPLCNQCYKIVRETPSWSFFQLVKTKASIGDILLSLHNLIPHYLGYKYYMFFVKRNTE